MDKITFETDLLKQIIFFRESCRREIDLLISNDILSNDYLLFIDKEEVFIRSVTNPRYYMLFEDHSDLNAIIRFLFLEEGTFIINDEKQVSINEVIKDTEVKEIFDESNKYLENKNFNLKERLYSLNVSVKSKDEVTEFLELAKSIFNDKSYTVGISSTEDKMINEITISNLYIEDKKKDILIVNYHAYLGGFKLDDFGGIDE